MLNNLPDGTKIYLCPVGFVYGHPNAYSFQQTGLMFLELRVVARVGLDKVADFYCAPAVLLSASKGFSKSVRQQIVQQLQALQSSAKPVALPRRSKSLVFTRPLIMGILNVTPDSFSDGGKYIDPVHAVKQARAMVAAGADIIDIGGESTRPGAEPVWEGEEAERVVPVMEALREDAITLSIDTRRASVMEKALAAGADIINDVSALTYDSESMRIVAESDAPVILMHAQGTPEVMQDNPHYADTLLDVYDYLSDRITACENKGIDRSRIIIDPGIGFGKRMVQDNLALINGMSLFTSLGCPILFGASRKSFIGAITGETEATKRLPGSLMAAMKAVELGAHIIRVHDVVETRQALLVVQAFRDAATVAAMRKD
ncbi:dihydropteroate synthase [Kordiimonas pumila]|uniref:dihydropteroate synthase n=1 Tax=Kordiimonas pumila TaxID=2161677 RepID=A0ABV7D783_9PROT|nr:dihydropteroate synthase [Kordiimonas pumila]